MYWDAHDKYMISLKELYDKTSKQTQNRLQELFNAFEFNRENLYNIADTETKNRVNTYIEGWKEQNLLTGYFGMLAKNIYAKTRVKNSEILELLIYGAYMEEQANLQDKEQSILYNDANYYYKQGQIEVIKATNSKKEPSVLEEALFLYLLNQPNYSGFTLNQQIQATIQYNAQQLYKQAVILLEQEKELKTNSDELKNLIEKQNKTKINIKDNKISGSMDLNGVGLNNKAKIEGIKKLSEDEAKVKFIAITDERTTDMCQSLNGQEFYISKDKENVFDRYWGESAKETTLMRVRVRGLVVGVNLPPIQHFFHYCRSTITYQAGEPKSKIDKMFGTYKDITSEFLGKEKKYKIVNQKYFIDNDGERHEYNGKTVKFDEKPGEAECAELLGKMYGGNIRLIPVVHDKDGVKTPDYMINGEKWDLKSPIQNKQDTLDREIKGKKGQANNFIFDITHTKMTAQEAYNQVDNIYKSPYREWVDKIVIIENNEVIKVFKRK